MLPREDGTVKCLDKLDELNKIARGLPFLDDGAGRALSERSPSWLRNKGSIGDRLSYAQATVHPIYESFAETLIYSVL